MGAVYGSSLFAKILILGGVAGILTSWNGFIIGASRILYAMIKQGMMPSWFGKLHPKYKLLPRQCWSLGSFQCLVRCWEGRCLSGCLMQEDFPLLLPGLW